MMRFKKSIAFTLVLAFLLGLQATGFALKSQGAQTASPEVSKNHPASALANMTAEKLNPDYVSVESRVVRASGSQVIRVGLGADLSKVVRVSLNYQQEGSPEVLSEDTADIKNGYITFAYSIAPDTVTGKYKLKNIELKSKDGSVLNRVDLETLGAGYTVASGENQAAPVEGGTASAASSTDSNASAVVGVDKNKTITASDIGAAIESSKKAMKDETGIVSSDEAAGSNDVKAAGSNVTIVLDPGHGGTDSGAAYNGLVEKALNLKIARYAKEELETYDGVIVGMTRNYDSNLGLEQRAISADQQGANILVSLHNNAMSDGSATGAEVFVSVLNAYHDSSAVLGNMILNQLEALGLYDRGVKARASENGNIFTLTGELADYYGVIRYSAYRGFPGIIVEHAFMDNTSDAQKYLSSDAKLKELGVADATALAQYYGLKKKASPAPAAANVALGKLPTASTAASNLTCITDGSKAVNSYSDDYPKGGLQYVQFDLGACYDLSGIWLWHYYGDGRKYRDVVIQVSNDPAFKTGVTAVYNNDTDNSAGRGFGNKSEYAETSAGLNIPFSNLNARYVRFYSNGSNMNSNNHYVEIEIYGSKGALIHPSSVSMSKTAATLAVGGTDTLTATVLPLNSTDKSVTWSSSAPGVAAVTSSGLVTGVSTGTATITAATADGGYTASCIVTVTDMTQVRLGGADRFETAAKVSAAGWSSAGSVVLASSDGFADALAGVTFAYIKDAPILLTYQDRLPEATASEIARLNAKNLYILGGTGAVSEGLEEDLKEGGYSVQRLSGNDRFETDLAIGNEVLAAGTSKTEVLTTAYNYPDALAISPYAAMNRYPVLLQTRRCSQRPQGIS